MPASSAVLRPPARRRLPTRIAVGVCAATALLVGLAPAVSYADTTPVRIDTPITISGTVTVSDSAVLDIPAYDISGQYPPLVLGGPDGRPDPGRAHLFGRRSGKVEMTDAQFAALAALEDDANAAVRALHGMSDTGNNHDLVVKYDRPELLAALYARLQKAAASDTPTRAESDAVGWLVAVQQRYAIETAEAAKAEFDRFTAARCTYTPPAPFTDWPTDGEYDASCRKLLPGEVAPSPEIPTNGQFAAWGEAVAHPQSASQIAFAGNASAEAIGWGAGAGALAVTSGGLATAQLLTGGGLTSAIYPFAGRVATVLASPAIQAAATQSFTVAGGVDAATVAARTGALAATTATNASRFVALLPAVTVGTIALAVAATVVTLVLEGIDAFSSKTVERDLNTALANAQATRPDLRSQLSEDAGRQQVFFNLADAVVDCNDPDVYSREVCNIDPALPTRRADDPVFQVATTDGSQSPPITSSIPITVGPPGAQLDTRLTIRDGWVMLDGIPQPLTRFQYTDWEGRTRTARLTYQDNAYVFQSSLDVPIGATDAAGTGVDPSVQCRYTARFDQTVPCFFDSILKIKDRSGSYSYLNQLPHRPPVAPTPGAVGTPEVGRPITFSATPDAASSSSDGARVTDTWTVESDDRGCVRIAPDDLSTSCRVAADEGRGPHNGYLGTLPGSTSTVVWNTPGTYRVTATRTDDLGVSISRTLDITITSPASSLTAACTAPCAAVPGGAPVTVTGTLGAGATLDGEAVTVEWGDGTTSTGRPQDGLLAGGPIGTGMTGRVTSVVDRVFTATHSYTGKISGSSIRVTARDPGNGDPAPVTLTLSTPPVVDASSYGNASADTAVDRAKVDFRVPRFTDTAGAPLLTRCVTGDPVTGAAVVPGSIFGLGSTLITCSATNTAGLTSSVSFSVTVHSYTITLVPDATTVRAGNPVVFTPRAITDDGRDIGAITDQGIEAIALSADTVCNVLTCRRTSSWGAIVVRPYIGDNAVGGDVQVYTVANLPTTTSVVSGDGQSAPAGTTLPAPLTALVTDTYGNPVQGAPVTFTITSGSAGLGGLRTQGVQLPSGADGRATAPPMALGTAPGVVTVTATTAGATTASWRVSGVAAPLRGVSGNGQTAVVDRPSGALVVRVDNADGTPAAGVPVTFTITSGGASLEGALTQTVQTAPDGTARVTPRTGTVEGLVGVAVTAGSYGSASLSYEVVRNTAPTAVARTYVTTAGGTPLTAPAPGVLAGATDGQGDPLTAVLVKSPAHGTVALRPDGSFSYVPGAAYAGTDSFTWKASDGYLSSAVTTVTVDVLAATADLGTTLTAPTRVARGSQFAVKVTLTSRGPSVARLVSAAVVLPPGLKVVSAPSPFRIGPGGRTALIALPSLATGRTLSYTLTVRVDPTATTGTRTVTSAVGSLKVSDPVPADNTARVLLSVS